MDEVEPGYRAHAERGRKANKDGKVYERECAKLLRYAYPKAQRMIGQSRIGSNAPDIGYTPFWIECGKGGTISIVEKIEQGLHDSAECQDTNYRGLPVIAMTRTRAQDLVTMRREDFIPLMRELELLREKQRKMHEPPKPVDKKKKIGRSWFE